MSALQHDSRCAPFTRIWDNTVAMTVRIPHPLASRVRDWFDKTQQPLSSRCDVPKICISAPYSRDIEGTRPLQAYRTIT